MRADSTLSSDRVLFPDGVIRPAVLTCAEGRIVRIAESGSATEGVYNASGLLVLPGIVDLHGDAFERQITPRPQVGLPVDLGLLETDQQIAANGITTAFHGLTVSWEPGPRDAGAGLRFMESLARVRPMLGCDTRVHLRHEALSLATVDLVSAWIEEGKIDLLGFNDHSAMVVRDLATPEGLALNSWRTGLPVREYEALAQTALQCREAAIPAVERLASLANAAGVTLASHDDEDPEMRAWFRKQNCRICEFPITRETAEAAAGEGDWIVFGAPNVVRGASHCRRMPASEAVRLNLCSVLTSDYYYPSLLHGAFRLASDGDCSLAESWSLVSRNPARAVGLTDRGEIAEGRRADLAVVDDGHPGLPHVVATFVEGAPVYVRGQRILNGHKRSAS